MIKAKDISIYRPFALFISMLFLITCGSASVRKERESNILKGFTEEKKNKYDSLLVDINKYTTEGHRFHERYYKYLIGIAGDITEIKKLTVSRGSIGFYYDKRSGNRDKLYLGLDIDTGGNYSDDYHTVALTLLKGNLKDVLETLNSCGTIFEEDSVIGMVIGWNWKSGGKPKYMNIWIVKKDVFRFEDNSLTLDELIHRSYVTNTAGKVIRIL